MPAPIADLLALAHRPRRRVPNVTGMPWVDGARVHAVKSSFRSECQRAAALSEHMAKAAGQAGACDALSCTHPERLFAIGLTQAPCRTARLRAQRLSSVRPFGHAQLPSPRPIMRHAAPVMARRAQL